MQFFPVTWSFLHKLFFRARNFCNVSSFWYKIATKVWDLCTLISHPASYDDQKYCISKILTLCIMEGLVCQYLLFPNSKHGVQKIWALSTFFWSAPLTHIILDRVSLYPGLSAKEERLHQCGHYRWEHHHDQPHHDHHSHVLDAPLLPHLHGDECQAAQGQRGEDLQQVGHQPGRDTNQGGVRQ